MLPLDGLRVLDWTIFATGPCATLLLADLGAEVIKIESIKGGDPRRGAGMTGSDTILPHGSGYQFEVYNRNKKSITLDLSKAEGRQIVCSLAQVSDVFVQNFRIGVAERLGIDYVTLRKFNPKLIYANCSGYGWQGPDALKPGLDPVINAASGVMLGIGEPEMPPIHLPGALTDMSTALMLAYGITTALLCRERTGIGQEVRVSMLGTRIWMQCNSMLATIHAGRSRPRHSRVRPSNPLYNYYCCKDGKWLLLAQLNPEEHWPRLCRALEMEQFVDDPRFRDNEDREKNSAALVSIFDGVFATKTRDKWVQTLDAAGGFIYSAVKDFWEVANDPQVLENDFLIDFDHPTLGKIKEIGIPVELSETPGSVRAPAPQLGQHTVEVLADLLGFSSADIERLRDQKVIL